MQNQKWPSLPTLVGLLRSDPTKQTAKLASQEASLLEDVAVQFSSTYDFTSSGSQGASQFGELFEALVTGRLQPVAWRSALKPDHLMRVLQCVRLLTRDTQLRHRFVDMGAVKDMCAVFAAEAAAHCSGRITPFQVEILTEATSITKRLVGDEWGLHACITCNVHDALTRLLNSNDPSILPLVLVCLIGYAAHKEHFSLVSSTATLDLLCRIVQSYDLVFKRLAADLLALLARRESVVSELLTMNGLGRLVGQLQAGDPGLTQSLLRVVCYMAGDTTAVAEIYQTGTIPVLLNLVAGTIREYGPGGAGAPGALSSRIIDMQLVCTALTRIAEDDELAHSVRQCNGVTLLGKLLLLQPPAGTPPAEAEKVSKELSSLRGYVFRTLRFLFSMERNRKVFKRLFPPDIFAAFIDVGHYNASLSAYTHLVQRLEDLNDKQRATLSAALEDVSADRDGAEGIRAVRGGQYTLLEMLGRGAYGAVYKARRSRGEVMVALKEIPLSDVSIFGATEAERTAGLGRMGKEVEILSSLNHPNIVQYYESFVEGPYLYIAMELVEGVSLMDHLTSLAEKGKRMPEHDIWQVLIAVCLALHYIHAVKKIVHRDLTPANIVLGQGPEGLRHSKIADFGLAKRLGASASMSGVGAANSVVGTMPYTCPEIIQQEHYSEKADVWSLGCVLYHCMTLHAPFDGTNPLSVASKIVEGAYDAVCDPPDGPSYSLHLKQLQKVLMTVDPARRPSIEEVGALISGQLMSALDRLAANEQRLSRALALERANSRRGVSAGSVWGPLEQAPSAAGSPLAANAHLNNPLSLHHHPASASPMHHRLAAVRTAAPDGAGSGQESSGGAGTPTAGGAGGGGSTGAITSTSPLPAALPPPGRRQILEPITPGASGSPLACSPHHTLGFGSPFAPGPPGSAGGVLLPPPRGAGEQVPGSGASTPTVMGNGNSDSVTPGAGGAQGPGVQGNGLNGLPPVGSGAGLTGAALQGIQQWAVGTGGARTISLATSRLRPVVDPLTQILTQLHKVMWVEQLPPGLARDHRRRCIEAFRRQLFGPGSTPSSLKSHLVKLMSCDSDVIRESCPPLLGTQGGAAGLQQQGRPVDFGSGLPLSALGVTDAGPGATTPLDGCLTYDQMFQILESVLTEKGFYATAGAAAGTGQAAVPSAGEAGGGSDTEQLVLPPPGFAK